MKNSSKIFTENIDRIREVMGLVNEETSSKAPSMNVNLKKFVEVLKFHKLYSKRIENMLDRKSTRLNSSH